MAATVSGFFGFAISKVVDQFWTPIPECEDPVNSLTNSSEVATTPAVPVVKPVEMTKPTKPTQRQTANARRNSRRKSTTKTIEIELPADAKTRSYSDADPVELSSNASTCGSSDDEEEVEVEDIGEKEMRLMLERAQQIKRLTKPSRHQRQKEARSKVQAAKPKEQVVEVVASLPDVIAPVRIQNKTTTLWSWSVYSGFAVDTKIANRGPRNMRHLYCILGEAEQLESEELLLDLAAQVLAEN